MVTKRTKFIAALFEIFCIFPVVLLSLVVLTGIFVTSLPFILYKDVKDRIRRRK